VLTEGSSRNKEEAVFCEAGDGHIGFDAAALAAQLRSLPLLAAMTALLAGGGSDAFLAARIAARRDEHRSPLVIRCIDDYRAGSRFPLDFVQDVIGPGGGLP